MILKEVDRYVRLSATLQPLLLRRLRRPTAGMRCEKKAER